MDPLSTPPMPLSPLHGREGKGRDWLKSWVIPRRSRAEKLGYEVTGDKSQGRRRRGKEDSLAKG